MKLKFDKLMNLSLKGGEEFTVPEGELWKISTYQNGASSIRINKCYVPTENIQTGLVVSGAKIDVLGNRDTSIQSVVFKVVE